jgi:hypothetical protein
LFSALQRGTPLSHTLPLSAESDAFVAKISDDKAMTGSGLKSDPAMVETNFFQAVGQSTP